MIPIPRVVVVVVCAGVVIVAFAVADVVGTNMAIGCAADSMLWLVLVPVFMLACMSVADGDAVHVCGVARDGVFSAVRSAVDRMHVLEWWCGCCACVVF